MKMRDYFEVFCFFILIVVLLMTINNNRYLDELAETIQSPNELLFEEMNKLLSDEAIANSTDKIIQQMNASTIAWSSAIQKINITKNIYYVNYSMRCSIFEYRVWDNNRQIDMECVPLQFHTDLAG